MIFINRPRFEFLPHFFLSVPVFGGYAKNDTICFISNSLAAVIRGTAVVVRFVEIFWGYATTWEAPPPPWLRFVFSLVVRFVFRRLGWPFFTRKSWTGGLVNRDGRVRQKTSRVCSKIRNRRSIFGDCPRARPSGTFRWNDGARVRGPNTPWKKIGTLRVAKLAELRENRRKRARFLHVSSERYTRPYGVGEMSGRWPSRFRVFSPQIKNFFQNSPRGDTAACLPLTARQEAFAFFSSVVRNFRKDNRRNSLTVVAVFARKLSHVTTRERIVLNFQWRKRHKS